MSRSSLTANLKLLASKCGFTLIEVLIVVAILGLLALALFMSMSGQRSKADDARAKSDLERLKIAFEDYYNDNNCYPPPEWFDNADDCGGNSLSPYLNVMPCDRNTGLPYHLVYPTDQCSSFAIYATLKSAATDPEALNAPLTEDDTTYSYAVSSSNLDVNPGSGTGFVPGHNYYFCSAVNNCTSYNPETHICSPSYTDDANCGGDNNNKCPTSGSCIPR